MTDNDNAEVLHGPMMRAEQSPDKNDYATPPELWRPLADAVDGFDVDPCSGAEATPIADTRYTKEDNGLEQAWHGDVFVNPPWSSNGDASAKLQWLRKVRSEANRDAVDSITMLLPSDTSAGWFHKHVMAAPIVCFAGPGRTSFVGADRNPSFGLLIPVYGEDAHKLRDPLTEKGIVVEGRGVHNPKPQTTLGGNHD